MERDPEIQQVIDESKIRNLLDKYPRALDRQDHELLASLFHPGAKDEHGVYNGSASGYVDFMAAQGKPGLHWMHHNGTQIIEIKGDIAECETYTLAFAREGLPGESGYDSEYFLRVRYLDRVEKRDGMWKIAHRRVVYSPCHYVKIERECSFPGSVMEAEFPKDSVYNF
jgi:hypothetical protein